MLASSLMLRRFYCCSSTSSVSPSTKKKQLVFLGSPQVLLILKIYSFFFFLLILVIANFKMTIFIGICFCSWCSFQCFICSRLFISGVQLIIWWFYSISSHLFIGLSWIFLYVYFVSLYLQYSDFIGSWKTGFLILHRFELCVVNYFSFSGCEACDGNCIKSRTLVWNDRLWTN